MNTDQAARIGSEEKNKSLQKDHRIFLGTTTELYLSKYSLMTSRLLVRPFVPLGVYKGVNPSPPSFPLNTKIDCKQNQPHAQGK